MALVSPCEAVDRAAHGGGGGEDGVAVDGEDGHGNSFDRVAGCRARCRHARQCARRAAAPPHVCELEPARRPATGEERSPCLRARQPLHRLSLDLRCSRHPAPAPRGKATRNVAPPPGVSTDRDRAVQRLDDRRDDRQAEAGAAGLAGSRRVGTPEPLEDLLLDLLGDALAVVDDLDPAQCRRRSRRRRAARSASPRR